MGGGMADEGRASERESKYEGSRQACAGPLELQEVSKGEERRARAARSCQQDEVRFDSIGLDSGRSPRCVMGGSRLDATGTDRYREGRLGTS